MKVRLLLELYDRRDDEIIVDERWFLSSVEVCYHHAVILMNRPFSNHDGVCAWQQCEWVTKSSFGRNIGGTI